MIEIIPKILSIAFFLFGSAFAVGSVVFFFRRSAFLRSSLQTTGVVTEVEVKHTSGGMGSVGSTHYYPTVRFQTADGRAGDCKINFSMGETYQIGQPVIVNYNPQNPCQGTVLGDRKSQPVMPLILFGFIGAIFALIGFVMGIFNFL